MPDGVVCETSNGSDQPEVVGDLLLAGDGVGEKSGHGCTHVADGQLNIDDDVERKTDLEEGLRYRPAGVKVHKTNCLAILYGVELRVGGEGGEEWVGHVARERRLADLVSQMSAFVGIVHDSMERGRSGEEAHPARVGRRRRRGGRRDTR